MSHSTGRLSVVATPIGNLEDITLRAIRVLESCDLVAAEDTRRTLQLLNHLGCPKTLTSYHAHNRREAGARLLAKLEQGLHIALCTDAGMPCISDPGWELVRDAMDRGFPVEVIPGASAVVTAVAASGMDGGQFVFLGFLPRQGNQRRQALEALARESRMAVLYEAPHRLGKTLAALAQSMGERPAALCEDLTKRYEHVRRGTVASLLEGLPETPKGEYVLILGPWEGALPPAEESPDPEALYQSLLAAGQSPKAALAQVVKATGLSRREAYERLRT